MIVVWLGNGYYLYTNDERAKQEMCTSSTGGSNVTIGGDINPAGFSDFDDIEDGTPVQIIIVSLWYYW